MLDEYRMCMVKVAVCYVCLICLDSECYFFSTSQDSAMIATGSADRNVKIWSLGTVTDLCLPTMTGTENV